MAITLGTVVLSDAEVTDGIGFGDVGAAACLWVGQWSIALSAARTYVEPDEVPGLAAEALIATIAAIAVGRGPREDLTAFVVAAVTELGVGDDPPPASRSTTSPPEVFTSPMMTRAFADLRPEDQEVLWLTIAGEHTDQLIAEALNVPLSEAVEVRHSALTALQRDYLAAHTEYAEDAACRAAHGAMAGAVTRSASLSGETWVHMSECAWCTEAFHELVFSNVAINALIDRDVTAPAVPVPLDDVVVPAVLIPGLQDPAPFEPFESAAAVSEAPVPDTHPSVRPVVAPTPSEPGGFHAAPAVSRLGFLRDRRARIAAVAVAAVAATAVGVLVISGLNGPDGTPAAATDPSQTATGLPDVFESVTPPSTGPQPKPPPRLAASTTPTPSASPTAPSAVAPLPLEPSVTPRPSPTPRPSSTPQPSSTPTTAAPQPSPTPTPTAPPCSRFAHLFGLC